MSQITSQTNTVPRSRLNIYGYNCIGKHIGMVLVVGAPLFIGAGTLRWGWAWIFTLVTLIGWIVLSLILVRANPELLNERGKRIKDLSGTKRWDWIVMTVYTVLLLATPLVAGLDYHYGWSSPAPFGLKVLGITILIVSFFLLTWSMAANRFFAPTVRIQTQREHQVIESGPYHYVRHPGYVAVLLQFITVPLSLGTLMAWIPALLGAALFVLRIALEDRTLIAELPGYADYAQRTRYRLLPGVW